ncbi:MAG: hypothetical protein AB7E32_00930 [Desulfovibrio sp.]
MSIEWGFTESIFVFCVIALFFRIEAEGPALAAAVRSGFRSLGATRKHPQRSDFYCFFHSGALTGR